MRFSSNLGVVHLLPHELEALGLLSGLLGSGLSRSLLLLLGRRGVGVESHLLLLSLLLGRLLGSRFLLSGLARLHQDAYRLHIFRCEVFHHFKILVHIVAPY